MNPMHEALNKRLDESSNQTKIQLHEDVPEFDSTDEYVNEEMEELKSSIIEKGMLGEDKIQGHLNEYVAQGNIEKRAHDMGIKKDTMSVITTLSGSLQKAGGSMYYGLENAHITRFGAVASFRKEMDEATALSASEFKAIAGAMGSIRWVRFRYGSLSIGLINK